MPAIDIHAHIYPTKIANRAVEAIGEFYNIKMDGGGTTETILDAARRSPLTHFVVHSVATKPAAVETINTFIAEECAEHPELIGFATMHPEYEDMAAEIERIIDLGLRGVKLHPDTQMVNMDDMRLMELYEIIAGRLPLIVHTGDYRYDYSHPRRLRKILKCFPDLVVNAAHFGGWSVQEIAYDILHEERVFIDTSSSFAFLGKRRGEELIRMWGVDRVMFGSDFPMWDPAQEYNKLATMDFTDDEFDKLFCTNAERFLGFSVQ